MLSRALKAIIFGLLFVALVPPSTIAAMILAGGVAVIVLWPEPSPTP